MFAYGPMAYGTFHVALGGPLVKRLGCSPKSGLIARIEGEHSKDSFWTLNILCQAVLQESLSLQWQEER